MSIDWDGDTVKLILDSAPTVDPAVEASLKKGESVFIDYTDIQRQTTSASATSAGLNYMTMAGIAGLIVIGLALIVRKK